MDKIEDLIINIKNKFLELSKEKQIAIILLIIIIGFVIIGSEAFLDNDGDGFEGHNGKFSENGKGFGEGKFRDGEGDGDFGKKGATRSLTGSLYQLSIIIIGIVIIAFFIKPKKYIATQQHIMGNNKSKGDNENE